MNSETKLTLLSSLFVACVIAANLMGNKIADFKLFYASVGILVFPVAILVLDIIQEAKGREVAGRLVWSTLIAMGFILVMTIVAVLLPSAPRDFFPLEYGKIFGISLRVFVASMLAFLVSEFVDISIFRILKELTAGKALWLRANLSTLISEFIDTSIFMTVAFFGVTPKHDVGFLVGLIIPWWLLKCAYAFVGTPLVYWGAAWLGKAEKPVGPKTKKF